MAKIRCEAHNCNFNDNGGCRLQSIRIEGEDAETYNETLCDSYTDRTEHGFVNCTPCECACNNCAVECDAHECKYNEHSACTADRIDVGGENACCSSETECRTFRKE